MERSRSRSGGDAADASTSLDGMGDIVDYLQRAGQKYKEHIDLLRRQRELEEKKETSFKPSITPFAEQVYKQSSVRHSETVEERLHHLYERKLEREQQLREAKAKAEEAALAEQTHVPQLTERASRLQRDDIVTTSRKWLDERAARMEVAREEALRKELEEARGAPRITAYAQEKARAERSADVSIEDHLLFQEELRRRRQYARAAQHEGELSLTAGSRSSSTAYGGDGRGAKGDRNASSTVAAGAASFSAGAPAQPFVPAISKYAARLRRDGDVVERLYRAQRPEPYDEAYELDCTFHPHVSDTSADLSTGYYADPAMAEKPIYERLYLNPKQAPKYRRKVQPEPCTWHPQISEVSRQLVKELQQRSASVSGAGETTRETLAGDSPAPRLRRAASVSSAPSPSQSYERRSRPRTFAKPVITPNERAMAEETTFHPVVSRTSEQLWKRQVALMKGDGYVRTSEEARALLWRKAQKRKEDQVQREHALRAAEEMIECTFHPQAGRPPRRRAGGGEDTPFVERVQLWVRQRDERRGALQAELSKEAEAECTFQPRVDAVFPLPKESAKAIAGTDSFLRRQQEARQRREEAKLWWKPKKAHSTRRGPASSSLSAADTSVEVPHGGSSSRPCNDASTSSRARRTGTGAHTRRPPPHTEIESFVLGRERDRSAHSQRSHSRGSHLSADGGDGARREEDGQAGMQRSRRRSVPGASASASLSPLQSRAVPYEDWRASHMQPILFANEAATASVARPATTAMGDRASRAHSEGKDEDEDEDVFVTYTARDVARGVGERRVRPSVGATAVRSSSSTATSDADLRFVVHQLPSSSFSASRHQRGTSPSSAARMHTVSPSQQPTQPFRMVPMSETPISRGRTPQTTTTTTTMSTSNHDNHNNDDGGVGKSPVEFITQYQRQRMEVTR